MKCISTSAILAMFTFNLAGCASDPVKAPPFVGNEDLVVDGKLIRVTDVVGGPYHVLHNKDLTNGIYIFTSAGTVGARDNLPNAERIIRESLIAHGIKVADKGDGASKAISFGMYGSATMVAANNKADYSSVNTGKMLSGAGGLAAGIATGGIYAGVGYLVGALIPSDEKTTLQAFTIDKPVLKEMGMFTKSMQLTAAEDKMSSYSNSAVTVEYKLEKGKEAPEDAILKMMIDKWITQCIDMNVEPVSILPSPAASIAGISEAKK